MKNIFIILAFICFNAAAQTAVIPEYLIYLVRGEASILKRNSKPIQVKQHQLVSTSESINLGKGAEVALWNKQGRYFVFNQPGIYKLNDASQWSSRWVDPLKKIYLGQLYNELTGTSNDYKNFKKQNRDNIWGGVTRGEECNNLIFPVKGLKTAEDKLLFKWRNTSPNNLYHIKLFNSDARELASITTKDTIYLINLKQFLPSEKGKYYWQVKAEGADCEEEMPVAFELILPEEERQYIHALNKKSESIEERLSVIGQLEKAALITAAQQQFADLMKSNKDNPALAKSYVVFLLKYGWENEADQIWKEYIENRN